MTKLLNRVQHLRQKPHAVRERFAIMGAIVLVAVVLGSWYGIRIGLSRQRQATESLEVGQEARPFSVVGSAWRDFLGYIGGVRDNLPAWRNPLQGTPTSTSVDVSVFQPARTATTTGFTEEPPEGEQASVESPRDLREASVQYGFDLPDTSEENQDE